MGITTYIKIAGILIIVAVLGAAKWYYTWSQEEIATLNDNNLKLEIAIKTSEAALDSLYRDVYKAKKVHTEVNTKFEAARKDNGRLRELLSKHDLGFLAERKPGLIQNRAKKGTENVQRCFEILSGSPLTDQELQATKKSQLNTSCPEIANPNREIAK
jgi:hypothetical protein